MCGRAGFTGIPADLAAMSAGFEKARWAGRTRRLCRDILEVRITGRVKLLTAKKKRASHRSALS